jgi:large subunit ribosomal protein L28e
MSSQLVWELVKKHNSFVRKNAAVNGAVFSAEPGNLANLSSFKHSGLANRGSTVDVALAPAGDAIVVAKSSKKSKTGALKGSVVKKNARRANHAAGAEAASTRPDLKHAAQARASALTKGIRAARAAAKADQ